MKVRNFPDVEFLLLVGDIHGDVRSFAMLVDLAISQAKMAGFPVEVDSDNLRIVQLGDWGAGWENAEPRLLGFPTMVLDGNHEHFPLLLTGAWERKNSNMTYLSRGDVLQLAHGFAFGICGGADSIDKAWRTVGLDWFPEEAITFDQAKAIAKFWQEPSSPWKRIGAILAHDIFFSRYQETLNFATAHGRPDPKHFSAKHLQILADAVKPSWWFHGHHHKRIVQNATLGAVPFDPLSGSPCKVHCLDTISNYRNLAYMLEKCVVLVEVVNAENLKIHEFGGLKFYS
jgi:hypothetical protein